MVLFGVLVLIACVGISVVWYNKDGVLFFCNYSRLGAIVWMLALGLYDLMLSSIYQPTLIVNVVSIGVILNFLALGYIMPSDIDKVSDIFTNISDEKRKLFAYIGIAVVMLLGIFSFAINLKSGQLRLFIKNRGISTSLRYSYFLNAMVATSMLFYYLFRVKKKGKLLNFCLFLLSFFLVFSDMSRGPVLFIATGLLIFELCNYVKKKNKKKLRPKTLFIIIVALILFVMIFGSVGQARTTYIFANGTNNQYGMKENMPTGFTWIYIYLSSPLENISYTLTHQKLDFSNYTYFQNLFYPFIKTIANLFGAGKEYAAQLASNTSVYPALQEQYGLNVSTFLSEAYLDFGYVGIIVYLVFYDLVGIIYHKIIMSDRIGNLYKATIIPLLFQISLWSVFANSIFRIAGLWVNIFILLIINHLSRYKC